MCNYTTKPMKLKGLEDLLKIGHVFTQILKEPTDLNGYKSGCATGCGECEICQEAKRSAAAVLTHPRTLSWEVWSKDPVDLVGILMLSGVDPGRDATAHFKFFDNTLHDKTEVLHSWFEWAFDKFKLRRISYEAPHYAFSALNFARKLGFGGDFKHREFKIEGIKRNALVENGKSVDLIIMGKIRDADKYLGS